MVIGRKTSYIYITNSDYGKIIRKIRLKKKKNWSYLPTQEIIYGKPKKLFRNTNITLDFKTTYTIGKLVDEKRETNPYEQSGIYKITCQSCQKVYIGQTGRNLTTRYKEHIRLNKDKLAFAQHTRILNKRHQY
jgi:hypothetical protein